MSGRTVWLVPALLAASAVASLGQSTGSRIHVTIDEWPVPQPKSRPHDPAVAPDGAAWYTGQMNNTLGRLDPSTGNIQEFQLPTPKSGPHGLVADTEGNISRPYGIVVTSKGVPVFDLFNTNKIGTIDPKTMAITEYALSEGARPRRIAVTADDTIYYTDYARGYLGRVTLTPWNVEEFKSPGGERSRPYAITATSDGAIWYSESGVEPNTIVRFDPKTATFQTWPIPSGGGVVRHMVTAPNGDLWIACSGVDRIGRVRIRHKAIGTRHEGS